MLKQIKILVILFAAFALTAAAQTTNYFPGTGNVGIGTTSPNTTLQVNGAIAVTPSDTVYGYGYYATLSSAYNPQPLLLSNGLTGPVLSADNYGTNTTLYANGAAAMTLQSGGNVGIGMTSPSVPLEVYGSIKITSTSGGSFTYADNTTQSTAWTGTLTGGDYAESMDVTGSRSQYEPGDVLALDPNHPEQVEKAAKPYSTLVAGVYSTRPGAVGRRQKSDKAQMNGTEVPMAMIGVVPMKVSTENGSIHTGDLLVSSSKAGYAMKGKDHTRMIGAVIGKAMGPLDAGTGVIEALISLQ